MKKLFKNCGLFMKKVFSGCKKAFNEHDLVKLVGLVIIFTMILTWIIPAGQFQGKEFVESEITRIGILDLFTTSIYGINYFRVQILFIIVLGGFYGLLSKIKSYQALVSKSAKFVKGKEIPSVIVLSLIFAVLASMSTGVYQLLLFVPFVITVLLKAKLDKVTAFSATFGSVLIGLLGATYSQAGIQYLVQYLGLEANAGIWYRFGVLALAFVVFAGFMFLHIRKQLKNKNEEKAEDLFAVEEPKKGSMLPALIVFAILFIFVVLGYIAWQSAFEIDVFANFHEWLIGLKVGGHEIFSYLIGFPDQNTGVIPGAFGTWDLIILQVWMVVAAIVLIIIDKTKFNEVISAVADGMKKMLKPITLLFLINIVFILVNWSIFVPTIGSWILSITKTFNIFTVALVSAVSALWNTDFGYTGFLYGAYFAASYAKHTNVIMLIVNSIHGLVSFVLPTSLVLMFGLSYMDIKYCDWIKFIWKFVVALLVLLLIAAVLLVYVF